MNPEWKHWRSGKYNFCQPFDMIIIGLFCPCGICLMQAS